MVNIVMRVATAIMVPASIVMLVIIVISAIMFSLTAIIMLVALS
jgi:hypothetical protein